MKASIAFLKNPLHNLITLHTKLPSSTIESSYQMAVQLLKTIFQQSGFTSRNGTLNPSRPSREGATFPTCFSHNTTPTHPTDGDYQSVSLSIDESLSLTDCISSSYNKCNYAAAPTRPPNMAAKRV